MNKEEQVIMGFRDLFNKLVWLNKDKMENSLKGYKPSEVHCIEYIERNVDSNVTKLAESFYMTRGAISKITKQLLKKALSKVTGSRITRKKFILGLLSKGKLFITFMRTCTKNFKSGIKPYSSR